MTNTIYTHQDHLPKNQPSLPEKVQRANEVVQKIHALSEEAEALREKAQNERKIAKNANRSNFWIPFVAPLIAFCVTLFVGVVVDSIYPDLSDSFLIVGTVIFTIVIWILPKNNVQKYLDKAAALEQEAANNYDKIECLQSRYQDSLDVIPQRYRYPIATAFIADVFQAGRAETMSEALDKLEEQIHRWKMEAAMQEVLDNQQNCTRTSGKA